MTRTGMITALSYPAQLSSLGRAKHEQLNQLLFEKERLSSGESVQKKVGLSRWLFVFSSFHVGLEIERKK